MNRLTNPSFTDDDTYSNLQPFASAENTNEDDVHQETCFSGFNLQEFSWTIDTLTELRSDSTTIEQSIPARKMDLLQTLEKHCLRKLYGDCISESPPSVSFKTVSVRENNLTLASTLLATDNKNNGSHKEIKGKYYEVHYTYIQLIETHYENGIVFRT